MIFVKDGGFWKEVGGGGLPPLGEPMEGGFFMGVFPQLDGLYGYVVADKAAEVNRQWKTGVTASTGTAGTLDGLANSNAMNNAEHPAAQYCRTYAGGGFNDWFLLAYDELRYFFWLSIGPTRLLTPPAFKTGGSQALTGASLYWSSTEASVQYGRLLRPEDGYSPTVGEAKTSSRPVRPARRFLIA